SHLYRPSRLADILYFLLGFAGAAALVAADYSPALVAYKPAFYLLTMAIFLAYLLYFAMRLFKVDETGHAVGVLLVAATGLVIAVIYDYFQIPGDDEEHTLFYIAALSVWAYMLFELYHAYCALERAEMARSKPSFPRPLGRRRYV